MEAPNATISRPVRDFTPGGAPPVSRNASSQSRGSVTSILCMPWGAMCEDYIYLTHRKHTGHSGEGWIDGRCCEQTE
jgi:hypothetical protein